VQSSPRRPVVEVRVELKPGVLDAEADSVQKSLTLLGIAPIVGVRTAKVFTLEFGEVDRDRARELAREAVDRLLANPVIHRVSVAVLPS